MLYAKKYPYPTLYYFQFSFGHDGKMYLFINLNNVNRNRRPITILRTLFRFSTYNHKLKYYAQMNKENK